MDHYFLSWMVWDPPKEIVTIPGIQWPILWYSVLFFLGFFFGFYILKSIFCRYFLNYPFLAHDDVDWRRFFEQSSTPKNGEQKKFLTRLFKGNEECLIRQNQEKILSLMNHYIREGEERFSIPFPKSYILPKQSAARLFLEKMVHAIRSIDKKGTYVVDKLTIYIVIATLLGARLGHLFFYEQFSYYLYHPIEIINFWTGGIRGLSSHGAAFAILLALLVATWRFKKFSPPIRWLTMLDFLCVPAAFCGFCIRLGNFFNQEILGTSTQLFWGIIFAHPADGSVPEPRHPVQLYEALFYLLFFLFLFSLSYRSSFLLKRGKLISLFLIGVFSFRLCIEFVKMPQSIYFSHSNFLMGQYLSIPLILLGIFLWFYSKRS